MKRQHLLLGGGVLLLLVLNLWQWWPSSTPNARRVQISTTSFRPEDFLLKNSVSSQLVQTIASRDLFELKLPPPPPVKKVELPPPPPPKTPEQLAEEVAHAELAQFKLVGVVFRAQKGQAYLVKGDQTFLVHVGEKVGERFIVESLRTDNVVLKDPATNVSGQIQVSGK